jgi:hypothetical protein
MRGFLPVANDLFIAGLALWAVFSLARFVHMYDRGSPFQRWRRWDWFHLVPRGAFFSPAPPDSELWIVARDFLPSGRATPWTEVPTIVPRSWWHALWNPQKHAYKAKLEAARALLVAAETTPPASDRLPPAFLLSPPYLALLRYVTALRRVAQPEATQFAVLEVDVLTNEVRRTVLSAVHDV